MLERLDIAELWILRRPETACSRLRIRSCHIQLKRNCPILQKHRPPAALDPVNDHNHLSLPRWKLYRLPEGDEVRANFGEPISLPVDQQKEIDLR